MHHTDYEYMRLALMSAKEATLTGDVPVGAVIVKDGKIIAVSHNTRERDGDILGHAEINAIKSASKALGTTRLDGAELYVTLEPCCMCAGAIINARIKRVVYAALDERFGCMGSVCDLCAMELGHHVNVKSGVLAEQSSDMIKEFFKNIRNAPKNS